MAPSAVDALRILSGAARDVEAIVTDLNMPRMDGFELIRRFEAIERSPPRPSSSSAPIPTPDTPARVADCGVDAFFAKPFSPAKVRRKLEQILDGTTACITALLPAVLAPPG